MDNNEFVKRINRMSIFIDLFLGKVKENDEIKVLQNKEYKTYVVKWDVDFQEYVLMLKNDDSEEWDDFATIDGLIQNLILSYLKGQCDDFIIKLKEGDNE